MSIARVIKTAILRVALRHNVVLPLVRGRRYVFLYHDVSEPGARHHYPVYSTTPSRFREQLLLLRRLFRMVGVEELLVSSSRENLATVVFDDGFASVLTTACPVLDELRIPFAVFANKLAVEKGALWCSDVVMGMQDRAYLERLRAAYAEPGVSPSAFAAEPMGHLVPSRRLGDDYSAFSYPGLPRVYLDAAGLRTLVDRGVPIGSHGVGHRVTARLSNEALSAEIRDNRRFLEQLTGRPIEYFALPFGFDGTYDARTLALARAEHRYVFSTRRLCFSGEDVGHPLFVVPRLGMAEDRTQQMQEAIGRAVLARHALLFES